MRPTPNHRPEVDPARLALAAVVAGQRLILDRLRLLTGITSAGVILLVVLGVAALLW